MIKNEENVLENLYMNYTHLIFACTFAVFPFVAPFFLHEKFFLDYEKALGLSSAVNNTTSKSFSSWGVILSLLPNSLHALSVAILANFILYRIRKLNIGMIGWTIFLFLFSAVYYIRFFVFK